jgi:hypothetical protein
MSATLAVEKATLRRVHDGLVHIRKGLGPFVDVRMRKARGQNWLHYASRASGSGPNDPLDAYGLLKTILDNCAMYSTRLFGRKTNTERVALLPWRWMRAMLPRTRPRR